MKIERTEDQTTLTFDNHDPSMDGLNSLLYAWHVQNKTLNAGQKNLLIPARKNIDMMFGRVVFRWALNSIGTSSPGNWKNTISR